MPSSNTEGTIVSLQRCPGHRLPMESLATASFVPDRGIEGDSHAMQGKRRQVLLIESETLEHFALPFGIVKENITTRGIALMALPKGQRLQMGNAVVIELTGPCEPCSRMEEIRPGLQSALDGQRGMLARVIVGGKVRPGDAITLTPASTEKEAR